MRSRNILTPSLGQLSRITHLVPPRRPALVRLSPWVRFSLRLPSLLLLLRAILLLATVLSIHSWGWTGEYFRTVGNSRFLRWSTIWAGRSILESKTQLFEDGQVLWEVFVATAVSTLSECFVRSLDDDLTRQATFVRISSLTSSLSPSSPHSPLRICFPSPSSSTSTATPSRPSPPPQSPISRLMPQSNSTTTPSPSSAKSSSCTSPSPSRHLSRPRAYSSPAFSASSANLSSSEELGKYSKLVRSRRVIGVRAKVPFGSARRCGPIGCQSLHSRCSLLRRSQSSFWRL